MKLFMKEFLGPAFPPIFHKWFLSAFPEPNRWLNSRLNYARTIAVWSMVGFVVGLGDRHNENILIDMSSGEAVHVDFSCLFDKGKTLDTPETVPFRLTNNLLDGLGVSGHEGIFRKASEMCMAVLRENQETLMSVLDSFVHDPLVEWEKNSSGGGVGGRSGAGVVGESVNEDAEKHLNIIRGRLHGETPGAAKPLPVAGQVHQLIVEATSIDNLSKMYIWWMPWM